MIQASIFPSNTNTQKCRVQVNLCVDIEVGAMRSTRDAFAAAALTGYLSNPKFSDTPHEEIVQLAYEAAEEMEQLCCSEND